ncbi:MAG: AraC family transcriptional regulator [Acutalibacteraceae bacterium]|nr:AraC family transcriptional regulator [Acutalibacteraceae bacterium]
MKGTDIRIEEPRAVGQEIEFFVQRDSKNTTACCAHIHKSVELLYIKEGSYTVSLDNTCYEIGEGDLILFCSGAIHHVVTGESVQNSYYVIKIPPTFFFDFARRDAGAEYAMRFALNHRENKCLWHKEELEESEIKRVLDTLVNEFTQGKYASDVAIKLKIMELLLTILRHDTPSKVLVNDQTSHLIYSVMNYVQERFAENIDEKDLAKSYGMSFSHFSRSFKKVTGMTFKNYLNRTRISKAEQLLFLKGCSVSEAAIACGYNSISYFIKVYRLFMGTTPYKALRSKTTK